MDKYPHFDNCRCGSEEAALPLSKEHEWWIDSKKHHNCFWTYLRHNTRAHTLLEVSKLLGTSISIITATEKKAIDKLKKRARQLKP